MGLGIFEDSELMETTAVDPPAPCPARKGVRRLRSLITHPVLGVRNSKGSLAKRVENTVTGQTLSR